MDYAQISLMPELKKLVLGLSIVLSLLLLTGCQTNEAHNLIDKTFQDNRSVNANFLVDVKLKQCQFTSDCAVVDTNYCGCSSGGFCDYLNLQYKQKWENNLNSYRDEPPVRACAAFLKPVFPPACINQTCVANSSAGWI